eukprot:TRINITY_DN3351_c0_g1_i1.p1 TRINITY_DN3351_c0_g1~~TRINITY_DN3351_c0_g1_i1.p1  ORF type:complete len:103 (+),score=27.13 TRINITY_DN3351_c0_g1_i1:84-392(+)
MARPTSGPAASAPSPSSGPVRPAGPPGARVIKRKVAPSSSQPRAQIPGGGAGASGSSGGLLRFYNEDSTGLKIGPTVVLVISLLFIAFVILLHFWGKFHRSS